MLDFLKKAEGDEFFWCHLKEIGAGRAHLGEDVPVWVYRLMQYMMKDALVNRFGHEVMVEVLREGGELAGKEFAAHVLDLTLPASAFFAHLQQVLEDGRVGVLRVERFDEESGEVTLTISEAMGCAGLPVLGEAVCNYDEGFLRGVMEAYTKHPYDVLEVDCWATGSRVCRSRGTRRKA